MLGKREVTEGYHFFPEDWLTYLYNLRNDNNQNKKEDAPCSENNEAESAIAAEHTEQVEAGSEDDESSLDSVFQQEGPLMADVSLYPPVVGPHSRTILTRVQ